jgi:hypothetical protein
MTLEKYTLKPENIEYYSKETLPKMISQNRLNLNWPIEIQGKAETNTDTKNFEIGFPLGDIFISFGIAIHELGHLRQEEFNDELRNTNQKKDWPKYIVHKEYDAYYRGMKRLKEYFPEVLQEIEDKFKKYKSQEKLKYFSCFKDLYHYLFTTINIERASTSFTRFIPR